MADLRFSNNFNSASTTGRVTVPSKLEIKSTAERFPLKNSLDLALCSCRVSNPIDFTINAAKGESFKSAVALLALPFSNKSKTSDSKSFLG